MKCAIAFYAIFISLCFCICQGALRTYYVEDLCYGNYVKEATLSLRSGQSGILASIPSESSTTECTIRLKPDYGSVLLSFYTYSFDTEDQLILEDSKGFKIALIGQAEFLDERKTFTSDGTLTIRYVRDVNGTRRNRLKFQFVFTRFHEYPCYDNEFECKNQRCISKSLVCDRHNHCGDNSDQEKCGRRDDDVETVLVSKERSMSVIGVGIIVGVVVLVIVITIIVAALISSAIKRKQKNKSEGMLPTVAASIPPAPSAPEMPPSFVTRLRQSFRRPNSNTQTQTASTQSAPEEPKSENEVPSMYPQIPSSPNYSGVENPEFKPDD